MGSYDSITAESTFEKIWSLRLLSGAMHCSCVCQHITSNTALHILCAYSPCSQGNDRDTTTKRQVCTLSVAAGGIWHSNIVIWSYSCYVGESRTILEFRKIDIAHALGNDSRAMMVASQSSNVPHFVCSSSDGQYCCDNGCVQGKSEICSHTIAVAKKNGDLYTFLQWYIRANQEPNITSLAMGGLPSGWGHKGGIPKHKRSSASQKTQLEVVVHRPATRPVLPSITICLPPSSSGVWSAKVSSTSAHLHNKSSGGCSSLQAFQVMVCSGGSYFSYHNRCRWKTGFCMLLNMAH